VRDPLNHSSVLIVSDDTEFARTVAARWRTERRVPEITLATSGVWQAASARGYDLVIVGPVQNGKLPSILSILSAASGAAAVCLAEDEKDVLFLRTEYPHLLVVPRQDGWAATVILVSNEVLHRLEAMGRAQRAERMALECQTHATLGRYMLEMRPSVNNALTSVLGNADLLLLNPSGTPSECREQIRAIHSMALRLNEIMQRFSSLASEMRACEKESHTETDVLAHRPAGGR
jgi:hypothetical protein